jgi:pimeloyl-ACP methyl ester carboxylesterase
MDAHHPFRSAETKKRWLSALTAMEKTVWPVASQSEYMDTSFGKTFVRICGPDSAPPLMLIHGIGGNSLMWAANIEALSQKFKTYAVDTVDDYGLSVYTRKPGNPKDYATWLDDLLSGLKIEDRVNIMGASYGGWLTAQYALHSPTRVHKIVLLGPACTVLPIGLSFYVRQFLMLLPFRYFKESFFAWVMEDSKKKDSGSFQKMVDSLEMGIQCFKPKRSVVRPTVLSDEELQRISAFTLFMVGENEKIYSHLKAIDRLNRVAPLTKKEVIPNAGHDLFSVQAETVNRKALEFLQE